MVVNIYEHSDLIPIATIDYFPGREVGYVKFLSQDGSSMSDVTRKLQLQAYKAGAEAIIGFSVIFIPNTYKFLSTGTAVKFKD
ncbi:selenium-binding protein [Paenibacillus sp. WQ 127069]|uniref:Selenium-binding protein n=1 Tax=Paenibacillus baimaensis TaxID=2982185 RepID=A0ABT2UCK1_9BACL|nr:selenium-binding protein [Paenibacillus sp. WQ 127069]MCU6792363.1 selenium-binding protein [Paenibacillus sp. WQ 127069]